MRTVLLSENCPAPCRLENYYITFVYEKIPNFRGILLYSVIFGLGVSRVGMYGRPVLALTHSLAQAMSNLSRWAVWYVTCMSTVVNEQYGIKNA